MNRIDRLFQDLRAAPGGGDKALMPYLTAGDPSVEATGRMLVAAQEAGASICELGIPFSDPVADGPVIQASMTYALDHGVTIEKVFQMVSRVRPSLQIGLVAMVSYSIVGHTVSLVCGGSLLSSKNYLKEGIEIIEIPYFPGRYILPIAEFAEEFSFNISLRFWINNNSKHYDIIHMQGRSGYLIEPKKQEVVYVQTIHGLLKNELKYSDNKNRSLFYKTLTSSFEARQIKFANKVLTVNTSLKNSVINHVNQNAENIHVVPNGVKIGPSFQVRKNTKNLVFIGRIKAIKNIGFLIELMRLLPWNITLSIIGSGPLKSKLEKQVIKYGLKYRIIFYGDLEREAIDTILKKSMALVLPSFHETQGIVLLEASANETPFIASKIPGIRDSVIPGETGILCDVNDMNAFKEAVMVLYNDPLKVISMGKKGKQFVQNKFNWKSLGEEIVGIYQNAIAS